MEADHRSHLMACQADVRLAVAIVVAAERLSQASNPLGRLAAEKPCRSVHRPADAQRHAIFEPFRGGADPICHLGRIAPPRGYVVEPKQTTGRVGMASDAVGPANS
jgi:hypothetical protein